MLYKVDTSNDIKQVLLRLPYISSYLARYNVSCSVLLQLSQRRRGATSARPLIRFVPPLDRFTCFLKFHLLYPNSRTMGKRRTAGRSFFSNLPLDLRSNIRSQTLLPLVAGANIQDLDTRRDEFDKEIGGKELLPTQPASIAPSDSDSSEEEDENAEECRNTLSQATAKGTRRSETEQERPKAVVAESSMDALRRRAEEMAREKEQRERVTREPQAASSATGISVVPSNKRGHDAILESKNGIGNDTSATTDNGRSFPASFNPSFAKKQKRTGKQKGRGRGNGGSRTNGIVEPVEVENTNRYKGHRWDCTGLVKRYTQPTEMPSELVKCKSPFQLRMLAGYEQTDDRLVSAFISATPVRYPPAPT